MYDPYPGVGGVLIREVDPQELTVPTWAGG